MRLRDRATSLLRRSSAWACCLAACGLVGGGLAGCASAPKGPQEHRSLPPTAKGATQRSGTVLLSEAAGQSAELKKDIGELELRINSALGAVNWNLMRYPHCVDDLFQTAADLDLGRRALAQEQLAIDDEIASFRVAAKQQAAPLDELNRLSNRVQVAQDRVTMLNAELAMLFSRTMRRESPCGDVATG